MLGVFSLDIDRSHRYVFSQANMILHTLSLSNKTKQIKFNSGKKPLKSLSNRVSHFHSSGLLKDPF